MKDYRVTSSPIDEQQVGAEVAFREASPIGAALVQVMLTKRIRQRSAGDHDVENVFESFGFELGTVFARTGSRA